MGLCLALFQVDHPNIVVRGLPIVNEAIRSGQAGPLRQLLLGLPFECIPELIERYHLRLQQLRAMGAPAFLIQGEERRLESMVPPVPAVLERSSFDQMRAMLGSWCREARSLDLDRTWDLLHWYCDADRRRRSIGDWRTQSAGFRPSLFDWALHGHEPYPCDSRGQPLIITGGSPEMSWYIRPDLVAQIAGAFLSVQIEDWALLDRRMDDFPEEHQPYFTGCEQRLKGACQTFERLRAFYQTAAARGFGVSVEFY